MKENVVAGQLKDDQCDPIDRWMNYVTCCEEGNRQPGEAKPIQREAAERIARVRSGQTWSDNVRPAYQS